MNRSDRVAAINAVYRERATQMDRIYRVSPWHRLYLERSLARIHRLFPRPARLLDAGGGTGAFATELARAGHEVVLVDASPEMTALARSKAEELPAGALTVRDGDIERVAGMELGTFDGIICMHVLPLAGECDAIFANFRTVIRDGGTLFFDIDNAYRWSLIEALAGRLDNATSILRERLDREQRILGVPYHFPTVAAVESALSGSGFELVNIEGNQFFAPYIHVFAKSADFLDPESLSESARPFLDSGSQEGLRRLEDIAEAILPADVAGWIQFTAVASTAGPAPIEENR